MKNRWGRTAPAVAEELKACMLAFDANGGDGPQGAYFLHQRSPGSSRRIVLPVLNVDLAISLDLCDGLYGYLFHWLEIEIHVRGR